MITSTRIEVSDEHREFLEKLRDSGEIKMHHAVPHLIVAFGLDMRRAELILRAWFLKPTG